MPDPAGEIASLRDRVNEIRNKIGGQSATELIGLIEGLVEWLYNLDDEVDELHSRIGYLEREDEAERK